MKLKLLVIAAFFFLGNVASAQVPSVTITRTGDVSRSIFLVKYLGSKVADVTVTVKDVTDNVVLTKSIKGVKDFSVPINFSSVDEGKYTIQVDNGSGKVSKELNYTYEKAPTYSHVVSLGDQRYLFTSSHANSEKITIRIYNTEESLIYEKDVEVKGDFATLFHLKEMAGVPTFEVTEKSGTSIMVLRNPSQVDIGK